MQDPYCDLKVYQLNVAIRQLDYIMNIMSYIYVMILTDGVLLALETGSTEGSDSLVISLIKYTNYEFGIVINDSINN